MEIIPGLPKDLALQCLIRVPYRFHTQLRDVFESWKALLSCAEFYKQRQFHGKWEEGVVSLYKSRETKSDFKSAKTKSDFKSTQTESDFDVIIYYPLSNWWERLPKISREFGLIFTLSYRCVFVRSKRQLVILGLLNCSSGVEGVLIFDFLSRQWRLGADMPRSRSYFACAASKTEPLVYVAGGYSWHNPCEALVYNVEENKWEFLPPMSYDLPDRCSGIFLDGKFYVVPEESGRTQLYDPRMQVWRNINSDHYIHKQVSALGEFKWLKWIDCAGCWINVEEVGIARNSQTRVGRFAVARRGGEFLVSVVQATNDVVYCVFNPRAKEEGDKLQYLETHHNNFIFSSTSVQI